MEVLSTLVEYFTSETRLQRRYGRHGKFHLTEGKVGSSTRRESVSCNIAAILASAYLRVLSFSIPVPSGINTTPAWCCKRVCPAEQVCRPSNQIGPNLEDPNFIRTRNGATEAWYTGCLIEKHGCRCYIHARQNLYCVVVVFDRVQYIQFFEILRLIFQMKFNHLSVLCIRSTIITLKQGK